MYDTDKIKSVKTDFSIFHAHPDQYYGIYVSANRIALRTQLEFDFVFQLIIKSVTEWQQENNLFYVNMGEMNSIERMVHQRDISDRQLAFLKDAMVDGIAHDSLDELFEHEAQLHLEALISNQKDERERYKSQGNTIPGLPQAVIKK